MTATVTVGTVFVRSWGYNQTQVDYYEIVSVSKSGKTAKARKIRSQRVHADSEQVVASTADNRFDVRQDCARCSNSHKGEQGWDGHAYSEEYNWQARSDAVTVTHYGDKAWRWDGKPDYVTAFSYGH